MLDTKQLDAVRKAELAAVIKKLASGKSLTASDRKLVDQMESEGSGASAKAKTYSINALSRITGRDPKTLGKALVGVKPAEGSGSRKRYTLADAENALESRGGTTYSDLRAEQIRQQTRESKARAELLEMERSQKRGELVPLPEVSAIINPILLSARQRLNALASEAGSKCNPTDPQHAERVLSEWVERSLPLIREAVPQANGDRKTK